VTEEPKKKRENWGGYKEGSGRPCEYNEKIGEEICLRLADGESLRTICANPKYPERRTVVAWAVKLPEFGAKYVRARQAQADSYVDLAMQVATNCATPADAIAARLAFDAYKWAAGKLKPGTYGDKIQHANADGDGNMVTEIVYRWATEPPPE